MTGRVAMRQKLMALNAQRRQYLSPSQKMSRASERHRRVAKGTRQINQSAMG
jgi:hypothetical protein